MRALMYLLGRMRVLLVGWGFSASVLLVDKDVILSGLKSFEMDALLGDRF